MTQAITVDATRARLAHHVILKAEALRQAKRALLRHDINAKIRASDTLTARVLALLESDGVPRKVSGIVEAINPAGDRYSAAVGAVNNLMKSGLIVRVKHGVYRAIRK